MGVFRASFGVIADLDPFTQTMNVYCTRFVRNVYYKYTCYLICYMVTQWCTLEASRIFILILVPLLSMFNLFLCHLNIIRKRPIVKTTLLLYEGLNCINQIGSNVIARISASNMGIAFIILVFINWIILKGWSLVPVEIYVMLFCLAILSYAFIFQTIPLAIKCDSTSTEIIRTWSFQVHSASSERSYLKRRVKAQQPVAIHYAQTKYEKDSQVHYYVSIVNYSINFLLLV